NPDARRRCVADRARVRAGPCPYPSLVPPLGLYGEGSTLTCTITAGMILRQIRNRKTRVAAGVPCFRGHPRYRLLTGELKAAKASHPAPTLEAHHALAQPGSAQRLHCHLPGVPAARGLARAGRTRETGRVSRSGVLGPARARLWRSTGARLDLWAGSRGAR